MCIALNKRKSCDDSMQPRKIQKRVLSILPNKASFQDSNEQSKQEASLNEYLLSMMLENGMNVKVKSYKTMNNFFCGPTKEEIESYKNDVLTAVRTRDIDTLRSLHQQGRPMKCSNRFGESLLHMACRRGMLDVVKFLINEAQVPFAVRDDYGRSPLHDACWTPSPNFELVEFILRKCPDLLYISDCRGHTPLSYVRREHWGQWKSFLSDNKSLISPQRIKID